MWPSGLFTRGGIHPNDDGARIVADYLLEFFKTAPFTRCWFVEGLTCSSDKPTLSPLSGEAVM